MLPLMLLAGLLLMAGVLLYPAPQRAEGARYLLRHAINEGLCVGCNGCVEVCPTEVLKLNDRSKSVVARFDDCILCRRCEGVCPTGALVMHREGAEPRARRRPRLDRFGQAAPGLYLIGEAAERPLVKIGINLGRVAVEHAVQRGGLCPRAARGAGGCYDVVIVGAGPAGLSAALSCIEHGLSYCVLEKDRALARIASYPAGKELLAEPLGVRCVGWLPMWRARKEELLAEWQRILRAAGLQVAENEEARQVEAQAGGSFQVRTNRRVLAAQRVVLAVGGGVPRSLAPDSLLPGEELPHVQRLLEDPEQVRDRDVLVVGGGDAAVEAALTLAEPQRGNRVLMVHRGKALSRAKRDNQRALQERSRKGRLRVRLRTQLERIEPTRAVLRSGTRIYDVPADRIYVKIGTDRAAEWLKKCGVQYEEVPHMTSEPEPSDVLLETLRGPTEANEAPGRALPEAMVKDAGGSNFALWDPPASALRRSVERALMRRGDKTIANICKLICCLFMVSIIGCIGVSEVEDIKPMNPECNSCVKNGSCIDRNDVCKYSSNCNKFDDFSIKNHDNSYCISIFNPPNLVGCEMAMQVERFSAVILGIVGKNEIKMQLKNSIGKCMILGDDGVIAYVDCPAPGYFLYKTEYSCTDYDCWNKKCNKENFTNKLIYTNPNGGITNLKAMNAVISKNGNSTDWEFYNK